MYTVGGVCILQGVHVYRRRCMYTVGSVCILQGVYVGRCMYTMGSVCIHLGVHYTMGSVCIARRVNIYRWGVHVYRGKCHVYCGKCTVCIPWGVHVRVYLRKYMYISGRGMYTEHIYLSLGMYAYRAKRHV